MSLWQRVYDREFERLMTGGATKAEIEELNRDRDENPIHEAEDVTELESRWIAREIADSTTDAANEYRYQAHRDRNI